MPVIKVLTTFAREPSPVVYRHRNILIYQVFTMSYSLHFVHLARITQRDFFLHVLKALQEGNQLRPKSNVAALCPFLDKQGVIRVGSTLQASDYI